MPDYVYSDPGPQNEELSWLSLLADWALRDARRVPKMHRILRIVAH